LIETIEPKTASRISPGDERTTVALLAVFGIFAVTEPAIASSQYMFDTAEGQEFWWVLFWSL